MKLKNLISSLIVFAAFCIPSLAFAQDGGDVNIDVTAPAGVEVSAHVEYQAQEQANNVRIVRPAAMPAVTPTVAPAAAPMVANDAYHPIENPYLVGRIFSDLGFTLLYDTVFVTAGLIVMLSSAASDSAGGLAGGVLAGYSIISLGGLFSPAFAVHTSHALLDGAGRPGFGYAGAVVGALAGGLVGAAGFANSAEMGMILISALSSIGGIVGAITWYEVTDKHAREQGGYFTIQNVHPVIEYNDQRTVFGVGFQF